MGIHGSGHLRRFDSLPAMQLFKYRVPADDAEIFDACTRRLAMCAKNYSKGILLSGLPLHLDESGRAHNWTPLASVLSRRGDQLGRSAKRVTKRRALSGMQKTVNTQRSTLK